MVGTTATPGNMSAVSFSIGPITSRDSGGGAPTFSGGDWNSTLTSGSPMTRISSCRISSWAWPGKMRQLTLAVARWGSAFGAWPPAICVATQLVRRMAFEDGSFLRRSVAAASPLRRGDHVRAFLAALDGAELLEVAARNVVELDLELVRLDLVQRAREPVDRILGRRARGMAALVAGREREVLVDLFRREHGDVPIHAALLVVAAAAAFVEREFGVDEIAVVLDQVAHAVEHVRRFFTAGEGELDAALRPVTFLLEAHHRCRRTPRPWPCRRRRRARRRSRLPRRA